ncbi:DUF5666 domain-containing protein [Occallatibacter riparius]|uniref:DUF5666 domain-containing protein n=1 Tax=Occallatibacter riparius TaxID=1002689 RepID=A0A9J7BMM0_9BACT|nr:DUF5666 domain-containing protein [Occallatibacter riparius]UWZ83931.1 DUF5666 domain-containing protein [Occallatibacter riparius]
MKPVLVLAMIGGAFVIQWSAASASGQASVSASSVRTESTASRLTDIPPMPKGKSTVMGGSIRDVDQVRDRFVLNVYGEKPMRILYDERTQVFRDGKKIALHDLGPTAHASVQTTLDGASIFAVTVHILSEQPSGDYQGRVKSFNPETGELTLTSAASREPFRIQVTNQTSFKREGQSAFSSQQSSANDLMPGSLVSVTFGSNNKGKGTAQEVSVLAAPGATFIFSGALSALDVASGSLTLVDAKSNRSYQIFFDPTHQSATNLRPGQHVRVSADYDGKRYVATEISVQ